MAGPIQHTVTTQQVQQLQQRIQALQTAIQQDRTTLNQILEAGNIVYRHQQRATLTQLNTDVGNLETAATALHTRGTNLRGAFTTETTFNTLKNDVVTQEGLQRAQIG